MKPFVVLGAGLTGLVAAEQMARNGIDCRVLEKEGEAGGACRSIEREGFTFDYTGHLLHIGREETSEYLRSLGLWELLAVHQRRASVVVGDHATPYPIQIHTHGLSPEIRRACLLGSIRAWASRPATEPETFQEWVLERFGDGLAEHFFFPYNEKLYLARPDELSLDWVGRYVPKPSLEEVVDGALGMHQAAAGYNAVFRYPQRGGIRLLPDGIAARLPELELGAVVQRVHLGEGWVESPQSGRVTYSELVSTVPLPSLIDMIVDPLPEEVAAARGALRWVRVLNIALGVCGEAPCPDHWLYFPDRDDPFYRVGYPSNHGIVAPPGHHTVSIEVSLPPDHDDAEALAVAAESRLEERGMLARRHVVVRQLTMVNPAYVVFDHQRRAAVATLRRFLSGHHVVIAGRWAEWKYSAMEDAILDGMTVARRMVRRGDAQRP